MRILEVLHWEPEFELNNRAFYTKRGDVVENLLLFSGQEAPDARSYDAVIVYGGYMSAYDDAHHPWIARELDFLESCMKQGTPVLGICLGSQLLARVLGARVYRSPAPEFGFKAIRLTDEGMADSCFGALARDRSARNCLALEWHADAWDLPSGAALLATSEAWQNQAFRYGPKILATQFHLEFTRLHMDWAIRNHRADVSPDPQGEDPDAFAAESPRYDEIRANMEILLGGFLATE